MQKMQKNFCKSKRGKLNFFSYYNGWERIWVKVEQKQLSFVCGSDLWKHSTRLKNSQNTTQHSFIKQFSVDMIKCIFILLKYNLYYCKTCTADMSVLFHVYLTHAFARVL